MKPEQLEAIRKRSSATSGNWLADYLKLQSAQIVLTDDVPALIDEVERLKSIIDELIGTIYEHANAGSALMDLAGEG
jgi:hypothetical protein